MIKDFNSWNEIKKDLDLNIPRTDFYERQIWWCYLGINVGSEQNGTGNDFDRPVLIFKKLNTETFVALPLSSKGREDDYFFKLKTNTQDSSFVLFHQVRVLSIKRLKKPIRFISRFEYREIIQKYKMLF